MTVLAKSQWRKMKKTKMTVGLIWIMSLLLLSACGSDVRAVETEPIPVRISIDSDGNIIVSEGTEGTESILIVPNSQDNKTPSSISPVTVGVDSSGKITLSVFNDDIPSDAYKETFDLSIKINDVRILNNDYDNGNGAEAYFVIFVTREYGQVRQAKLMIPPDSNPIFLRTNEKLDLSGYSLGINNIQDNYDEEISLYILGFDSDEQSELTNLALDAALAIAEDAIPGSSFTKFVLGRLSGNALAWWQNEDLLGEYSLILNKSNNWLEGTHLEMSSNENLITSYTIEYLK
jgi:hypothetical protein